MKTNLSKKELKIWLNGLMEPVQQVGCAVGNDELNYMTDAYRDRYADFECAQDALIADVDNLNKV